MALDKDRLGNAIVTALKLLNSEIGGANEAELTIVWKTIANEIILELKNNGVVNTTVTTPDTINGTGEGTIE